MDGITVASKSRFNALSCYRGSTAFDPLTWLVCKFLFVFVQVSTFTYNDRWKGVAA